MNDVGDIETKVEDYVIQDCQGRDIVVINREGRIAFARFPDTDEETKEYMAALHKEITGEDSQALMDFLDYKSEDNEFCV